MFYLTRSDIPVYLPLGFVGVYRYFWFIVKILAWALYKPINPRKRPTYRASRDVTILVPTIDSGEEIKKAVRTWLTCDPYEIIFITIPSAKPALEELARECDSTGKRIRVITVAKGNKRNQMIAGINQVKTEITVFCDDDVLWPKTMMDYMLAPFEDKQMGGVGTSQTVLPVGKWMTIWEILSAYRIAMRNIETTSSTYIDGGVCCLSGRTAAYRTCILRDPDFQWKFAHEYCHQWKTYVQSCKEAELESTFKNNWRFLKQITRWTRNTWRSDMKSLFIERVIWHRYPFVAFTMFDKFFNPITLLAGPISVIYLCTTSHTLAPWVIVVSYLVWLFLTRLLKYMPHFVRRPFDALAIPVWVVFNIVFAIMKVYCLFTLHITDWGTRKGADDQKEHKEDYSIFLPYWQDHTLHAKADSNKWHNNAGQGDGTLTSVHAFANVMPASGNQYEMVHVPSGTMNNSTIPAPYVAQATATSADASAISLPPGRSISQASIMRGLNAPVIANTARFTSNPSINVMDSGISTSGPYRRAPPALPVSRSSPPTLLVDNDMLMHQPNSGNAEASQLLSAVGKHISTAGSDLSHLSGFNGRDFFVDSNSFSGDYSRALDSVSSGKEAALSGGDPSGSGSYVNGGNYGSNRIGGNTQPATFNPVVYQINQMRAANGLPPITPDSQS
ncbi:hypothetical protein SeLEV6574_g00615 [Synchytrium endobioticum]|uniref:Glycosyltransferase family 2 protein n=1 Tax=Synchytrium endobioticum TaxID=286115 RepID=A0A507DJ44_9FUNG|nr:hypothetical protein SeLEV6574_g00615 [Synchytrium endobioticum]